MERAPRRWQRSREREFGLAPGRYPRRLANSSTRHAVSGYDPGLPRLRPKGLVAPQNFMQPPGRPVFGLVPRTSSSHTFPLIPAPYPRAGLGFGQRGTADDPHPERRIPYDTLG